MKDRRGRDASPGHEPMLPESSTQDPALSEILLEVTPGVIMQQYTLLQRQVQNLATVVQSLQQIVV